LGTEEIIDRRLGVVDLPAASPQDIEAAIAIYNSSFPDAERLPADQLIAMVGEPAQSGPSHFWIMKAGEEVVGLTVFNYLTRHNIGYLGYIAVSASQRGKGAGAWLFQQTKRQITQDAREHGYSGPIGLAGEVERVEDATTEAEKSIRTRRLAFYRRLGGIPLPVVFLAPPLKPGDVRIKFHLVFFPTGTPAGFPDRSQAQEIGLAILEDVYGQGRDTEYGLFLIQQT
jgi:GNAT superfamily N-acetyltransferase